MLKDLFISSLKNIIKGTGRHIRVFLALALIFLVIQPLFPPIVTIFLGIAVVVYTYVRFMKTSSRVIGDLLDAQKNNRGANHKTYGKTKERNSDTLQDFREIR
jgi:hypothetical protein